MTSLNLDLTRVLALLRRCRAVFYGRGIEADLVQEIDDAIGPKRMGDVEYEMGVIRGFRFIDEPRQANRKITGTPPLRKQPRQE